MLLGYNRGIAFPCDNDDDHNSGILAAALTGVLTGLVYQIKDLSDTMPILKVPRLSTGLGQMFGMYATS